MTSVASALCRVYDRESRLHGTHGLHTCSLYRRGDDGQEPHHSHQCKHHQQQGACHLQPWNARSKGVKSGKTSTDTTMSSKGGTP